VSRMSTRRSYGTRKYCASQSPYSCLLANSHWWTSVGRLIKASKQKIPTSSLQAGPAPIPNASFLAPSSPSSSSFSLPSTSQQYNQGGYQYTPTPHATQHINAKLALAQRELHACEAHLAGKEAELAEVRRSAMTEGMARRCRAMAEVGIVWRERGEQGMGALDELGRDAAAGEFLF
jgi:hypothetical protein